MLFETPYAYIAQRKNKHPYDDGASFGGSIIRKQHSSFSWDWAPSLPGCGIHRPIRIEARSGGRIEWVRVSQEHGRSSVSLSLQPQRCGAKGLRATWRYRVADPKGRTVALSEKPVLTIANPQLWWPNGHGDQPLYTLTVELLELGVVVDTWTRRIGLRTIELDRHEDKWGESFQFVVNGRPVYAKGANWVPPHSFAGLVDRARYRHLVESARAANMNMLRVWGGGLYEQESFYDACDEMGIMIWHDFMFSCSLYPAYREFIDSITDEADFQTRRLAHHASLALWCGNNELELMPHQIRKTALRRRNYDRIFHRLLPAAVAKNCPHISYWPASPHNPKGRDKGPNSQTHGDGHTYWDAWDNPHRNPAATNETYRFCSEFGMQSIPCAQTLRPYLRAEDLNAFSPALEGHEKHQGMILNLVKAVGQRYRFPRDFASLAYLTQINQAYWVGRAIAHQRLSTPRTMGSLYWQINDCWPAVSWSSIDFAGRWKALHWIARRLFRPVMIAGAAEFTELKGNHGRVTHVPRRVMLRVCNDSAARVSGTVRWTVYCIDGRKLAHGSLPISVDSNRVHACEAIELQACAREYRREELLVRAWIERGAAVLSETTVLLHEPRWIAMQTEPLRPLVVRVDERSVTLRFRSHCFQHMVAFDFGETAFSADDNYFDLFPGVTRTITVRFERPIPLARIRRALRVVSYSNSY